MNQLCKYCSVPLTKPLKGFQKNQARVFQTLQRHRSSSPSHVTSCYNDNVELDPDNQEEPLHLWEEASLYVHWPYCKKRCTYCNFNKYVVPSIDQDRMGMCLAKEAQTLIKLGGIKRVNSIFFGGGTPSLAEPWVLGGVIDAVRELVVMPTDAEISMEANPTSIEMKKLEEFKIAGMNRLSLGIQALNNEDLKTLGREHTASQSLACIQEARKHFPEHLSIDIIFGRPSQTLSSWAAELEQILQICDNHISLYQLTLEPGTLLHKLNRQGMLPIPEADVIADMYETAVERLAEAGFHRYEVSNFARSVRAESSHNKAYWVGNQYIGVGPGAHGRFSPVTDQVFDPDGNREGPHLFMDHHQECGLEDRTNLSLAQLSDKASCIMHHGRKEEFVGRERSRANAGSVRIPPKREARIQTLEPEAWMLEVEKYGHATRKRNVLSSADVLRELLLTGLRTKQGVSNRTWHRFKPSMSLRDLFGSAEFVVEAQEAGLLELDDLGLRCSHRGLNVLDSLLPDLTEIISSQYHEEVDLKKRAWVQVDDR